LWEKLKERAVPTEVVKHHPWRKLGGWLGANFAQVPELKRIAARFSPDVIHANEFHSCPQGAKVSAALGVPLCGHVRLTITPRQITNYYMASCARILCVSQAVAGLFSGSPLAHRTRVVYNGVGLDRFDSTNPHTRVPIAETADWPEEALVVGLFGLVSERKNQRIAAEAVALAAKRGADVRLLLAGDPFKSSEQYGDSLRARLREEDVRGRVAWLPFQREVVPLYRAIDINLLISSEEGFGRTIIEAGALARPSIGSNIGGIPELVRHGETGWVLPSLDAESLADVLVEAHRTRPEIRRRGELAMARVQEHFTLDACVRKTVEVWGEAGG
jgi:glycosyltransferase involved in cell wall biosynthesis